MKKLNYFIRIFKKRYKKEGIKYLIILTHIFLGYLISFFTSNKFIFKNKEYRYFYHKYNHTWVNERTIEIPIIINEIKKEKGKILEIGNVLKHYYNLKHDVVDKYEKTRGVINKDVIDFNLKKKYDFIVSISTIEHVGWDEKIKDKKKIILAINNLKKHLNKNGKIIITVPIGYNSDLDNLIKNNQIPGNVYFMKRKLFNRWVEANWEEVKNSKYKFDIVEGLAVLIIGK